MNYIKEVAKLLGCEVGEEFNIMHNTGLYSTYSPFKFTETSLVDKDGNNVNEVIFPLITGEYKIEKIPFIPKVGEYYWSYNDSIRRCIWYNTTFHKERKLLGIVFRTEQEAKDYLPTWRKRLEGEEL